MKIFITLSTLLVVIQLSVALPADISYTEQNLWPGICVSGNTGRQSPINIITRDTELGEDLTALEFNHFFTSHIDGEFENTCQNVEFTPNSDVNAIMTTPIGEYKLKQFHFHWGRKTGEGTEHLINGIAEEFEVHFVHERAGGGDTSAGNALAVLSVRGQVSSKPISGIFAELDASEISKVNAKLEVEDIIMADLFPRNRDYYYYEGSLTTPDCDETVQWFVFKNLIQVPECYLDNLREIEKDSSGNILGFNYRLPQDLNNRLVFCFEEDEVSLHLITGIISRY